jgi:hypothetical protein
MERYFSTGQSPQRAAAPTEEEEDIPFSKEEIFWFSLFHRACFVIQFSINRHMHYIFK